MSIVRASKLFPPSLAMASDLTSTDPRIYTPAGDNIYISLQVTTYIFTPAGDHIICILYTPAGDPSSSDFSLRNSYPGRMLPGMTFTIEPGVSEGSSGVRVLEDNWTAVSPDNSRSAQFEHTILVTEDGVEILTETQ